MKATEESSRPGLESAGGGDEKRLLLVVDDVDDVRRTVARMLEKGGFGVQCFDSGESCLEALTRLIPDAICLDLEMPGLGGLDTLARIRSRSPQLPVVMLTGDDAVENVVKAMRLGAYDYLLKPIQGERLLAAARNAVKQHRMSVRLTSLEREAQGRGYPQIIGRSRAMVELFREMDRVAASDISLLIHGESGTGKELVARGIHEGSSRKAYPFVAVNCAAIPEALQEAELFGHEKGAFTGASERRIGRFELAHRGTLFLDEIGELSPSLQAKLLRALQERTFHRVGSVQEIHSDFRLIAATHRDLRHDVDSGRFREDLYYRVVVFEIEVPPLRKRDDDIARLTEVFLRAHSRKDGGGIQISPAALELLRYYRWPGNVRELQNVLQRGIVFTDSGVIEARHLPYRLVHGQPHPRGAEDELRSTEEGDGAPTEPPRELNLETIERRTIERAMRVHGNVDDARHELGISRATLYRKLKKYGLRRHGD